MKALISQEEKDKKLKRNHLIMGLILILLMVFSTLGFAFGNRINSNSVEEVEYKGIKFVRNPSSGYWSFNIQGVDFITRYNPTETQDINFLNYQTINNYVNKPLYFVGESGEHFSELDRNLRDRFVLRTSGACLDDECEGNFPVKDCSQDNIIVVKEAVDGEEKIYQEENCIYIIASFANQVRYADAYLFDLLGIK